MRHKQDGNYAKQYGQYILLIITFVIIAAWLSKLQAAKAEGCKMTKDLSNIQSCHLCKYSKNWRLVKRGLRLSCFYFICAQKRQIKGRCICVTLNEQVSVNQSKWITNSEKNSRISEGLSNYSPVFMKARLQLSGPVWASCKHNQRELSPPGPGTDTLKRDSLTWLGKSRGSMPRANWCPFLHFFLNLITVMSLETVGCTTANVDAGKTHSTQVLLAAESKAHHQAQTQHR